MGMVAPQQTNTSKRVEAQMGKWCGTVGSRIDIQLVIRSNPTASSSKRKQRCERARTDRHTHTHTHTQRASHTLDLILSLLLVGILLYSGQTSDPWDTNRDWRLPSRLCGFQVLCHLDKVRTPASW
jgi:hypothetical protein